MAGEVIACEHCSKCAIYRIGFITEEKWCTEHHRQVDENDGCTWGEKGESGYAKRDYVAVVDPAVYGDMGW